MIELVHALVHGRARYKVGELYRSRLWQESLELKLREQEPIEDASASFLTGNVLIRYNSGNTAESIARLLEQVVSQLRNELAMPALEQSHPPLRKEIKKTLKTDASESRARAKSRKLASTNEPQSEREWHCFTSGDVLTGLCVSAEQGLSDNEVRENSRKYGLNILPESEPRSGLSMFLEQFQSLPVALLSAAAAISVLTGGAADALVIMGVVGINACIGYVTESQAERTIESLKRIVHPTALVVRGGRQVPIDIEEIVPGDVLVLRPGVYVPADGRLIEAEHLSVDESALTGESLPVVKSVHALAASDIPMADRKNMVYTGTLVTGGQGLAVAVATGRFTELGRLQIMVGEAEAPETPMEKELRQIGNQLVLISGAICGAVFLVGLLRGFGFIQGFKTSIALAVAAVPEGLPAVATTTLALGIRNMKKRNVLIRKLDAVETLGSVQTICFDKTGTVTQNRMKVKRIWVDDRTLDFENGGFPVDCDIVPDTCESLKRLLQVSVLCNESEIIREGADYVLHGTSTEKALVQMAIDIGLDAVGLRKTYKILKINHRSEDRHFMASLHEGLGDERLLCLKGSPIEVLEMCGWYIRNNERVRLDDEIRQAVEAENEYMAGEALRVLGFACIADPDDSAFESLGELTWLGLVGMSDPIRPGVKDLIPLFHEAGIDTVMITGDQSSTAYSIGKELGLSQGRPLEILDSTALAALDPEALKALSQQVHVFARVSPAHKLKIVQALQKAGRVVAMTGDGINDGPALKAADIGVALGASGTDVAREVSDVILEKDDLEIMIQAVGHGRTIYSNIRKALRFLLATNFSEIMVMFGAGALGVGFPLSARQLLWINLISDIFPGLALAMESPESDVLKKPPRDPGQPIIDKSDFRNISIEAAVMTDGAMLSYAYGMARFGAGAQAGTLAFQTLTLTQLLHAISCRSEKHSLFSREKLPPNKYLTYALGGSLAIQLMTMFVPGLRALLGLTPVGLADTVVIGATSIVPLLVNEMRKNISKDSRS